MAFVSSMETDAEIYKMNVDGSNRTNITNDSAAQDFSPDWQPL
jgi:Tol biopolymer transport system component